MSFRYIHGFQKHQSKLVTLEALQAAEIPLTQKLGILESNLPDIFKKIKQRYLEIFPHVEDLKHLPLKDPDLPKHLLGYPVLHIKERGVEEYIPEHKISAGMLRTLLHLADLYLPPSGSVVLIDEFENSYSLARRAARKAERHRFDKKSQECSLEDFAYRDFLEGFYSMG